MKPVPFFLIVTPPSQLLKGPSRNIIFTNIKQDYKLQKHPLREKYLYSELFWSVFSRIGLNKCEYGHFLRTFYAFSVQKLIMAI